jgi:hypothetical protein
MFWYCEVTEFVILHAIYDNVPFRTLPHMKSLLLLRQSLYALWYITSLYNILFVLIYFFNHLVL